MSTMSVPYVRGALSSSPAYSTLSKRTSSHRNAEPSAGPPKWLILPDSPYKILWELLVVPAVVYTVVAMPINLFFLQSTAPCWYWTEIAVSIVFSVDIILSFFTSYKDANGLLITSRSKIAINYMSTFFALDILSVMPFDQFLASSSSAQANKLFRLGRLVRIVRLFRLLRISHLFRKGILAKVVDRVQEKFVLSGAMTRLFKLFLLSILVAHLVGGVWFFVGTLNDEYSWLDTSDGELRNAGLTKRYFASVYWAFATLATVGYGDYHATNSLEFGISILVIMIGQIGAAAIVGDVLNVLSSLDVRSNAHKERTQAVQQLLMKVRLPQPLRRKLMDWASEVNKSISSIGDVMPMLSVELRREVILATQSFVVDNVHLFADWAKDGHSKDLLADLLLASQRYTVDPGSRLWIAGQKAHQLVFLLTGMMEIYAGEELVDTLVSGDMCGEFECLLLRKYVTDCVTIEQCDVVVVDIKNLETLIATYPNFGISLRENAMERLDRYSMRDLWTEDPALVAATLRTTSAATLPFADIGTSKSSLLSAATPQFVKSHRTLAPAVSPPPVSLTVDTSAAQQLLASIPIAVPLSTGMEASVTSCDGSELAARVIQLESVIAKQTEVLRAVLNALGSGSSAQPAPSTGPVGDSTGRAPAAMRRQSTLKTLSSGQTGGAYQRMMEVKQRTGKQSIMDIARQAVAIKKADGVLPPLAITETDSDRESVTVAAGPVRPLTAALSRFKKAGLAVIDSDKDFVSCKSDVDTQDGIKESLSDLDLDVSDRSPNPWDKATECDNDPLTA